MAMAMVVAVVVVVVVAWTTRHGTAMVALAGATE